MSQLVPSLTMNVGQIDVIYHLLGGEQMVSHTIDWSEKVWLKHGFLCLGLKAPQCLLS